MIHLTNTLEIAPKGYSGKINIWEKEILSLDIGDKKYILSKPIKLTIFNFVDFSDIYYAEQIMLHIFGSGKGMEAAINDAKAHLAYYYNYYINIEDMDLTVEAIELKNMFLALKGRLKQINSG